MSFNVPDTFDDEMLPNSSKYEKILKKFLVFMPYVNVLYFHIYCVQCEEHCMHIAYQHTCYARYFFIYQIINFLRMSATICIVTCPVSKMYLEINKLIYF